MINILIVDDDNFVLEQLTILIKTLGHNALSTLYPTSVIDYLNVQCVDLILLDINMPELDGLTLLKQLKLHPKYRFIPVVMLTGDDDIVLQKACYESGAMDFLYKPVNEVTFSARIYSALLIQDSIKRLNREIAERKKTEHALQKAHDELEQRVIERSLELHKTYEMLLHAEKLSAIGSLSASIAHEFNNPLQGILTIIKGIARRATMEKDDSDLLNMAVNECIRMSDLIRNLQDFNRPTSGKVGPVNIHAALDSLLILGKKEYSVRKIIINKKFAKKIPLIIVVGDQIKQVFLNLLKNASDACHMGGTITIETEVLIENVVIRIHDTGKGISKENKKHIFEPFFTTKSDMKGIGLGLSVSYGIVKEHRGEIAVDSKPGKGTVFSVTLPIKGAGHAEEERDITC